MTRSLISRKFFYPFDQRYQNPSFNKLKNCLTDFVFLYIGNSDHFLNKIFIFKAPKAKKPEAPAKVEKVKDVKAKKAKKEPKDKSKNPMRELRISK